jgi:prevent-host-death family protein
MNVKFSEDIVSLSSIKINPGKLVNQVAETHRPVLLTSRGRGVAVIQSLEDYEKSMDACDFMRAVVQGVAEIDEGKSLGLEEVKNTLGL